MFAARAKEIYESLGIDYREKMIIFSDALNLEKALKLKKQCDEIGFKCACMPPCCCSRCFLFAFVLSRP